MRILGPVLIAAATAAGIANAAAEEAYTTRIETRPYYGAVVSVEHGVRVIRPIPPTTHMIIDPRSLVGAPQAGSAAQHMRKPSVPEVKTFE